MGGDQCFQLIGQYAIGIGGCSDGLRAIQAKALNGRQKSRSLHNHLVAGVNHALGNQVQRLLAAGGYDELLGLNRCAFGGTECGDLLFERAKAFGCAVLQGFVRPLFKRGMRGRLKAFHIKQGRIRKAPGKADDAGLAQQFEQFADGGSFDVLQSLGKGQHGQGIFLVGEARAAGKSR